MKLYVLSRILAALTLAIILGVLLDLRMGRRVQAGRDAFLTEQSAHWERNYAHPLHGHLQIVQYSLLFVILAGVYECLVIGYAELLRRLMNHDQTIGGESGDGG